MSNNNLNDIVNSSVESLACVTLEDMKSLDSDILDKIENEMRYFMSCIHTVAAQKRAENNQRQETQKYLDKMEAIVSARNNANADCSSFDNLNEKDKNAILGIASLIKYAMRKNDYTNAEKIKCNVMEMLCDHNIGNKYVLAHVINLAS